MRSVSAVLLLVALLGVTACRIHDVRTVVIRAPGIGCEACAQRVAQSLGTLEGVKPDSLSFDFEEGTVSVTYDSMLVAIKNLEFAVAAAGYAVEAEPFPLPADPAAHAALPEECREHLR